MTIRQNALMDRVLFCPPEKVQREAQIWHTVFSMMNALQSTLLLFLVTRIIGSDRAGVISLAFSVSYLMIMIGNYGVRNYQATDVNRRFGFREYRIHRWATCLLMALASVGYVALRGYAPDKAAIVLLCCLLKLIESVENVYHGEYQRANRLDVASKAGTIRIVLTVAAFVVALLLTDNLLLACLCMDLTALFSLTVLLAYTYSRIPTATAAAPADWKRLFTICLPLFVSTFCYIYICNASKYALDRYDTEVIQGHYGMIFMPVFAINLISNCIYGPFLVRLAGYWNKNYIAPMRRFVRLQIVGILIITVAATAVGYLIGTQVLSLVFGVDLSAYRMQFTVLLVGSGMTALVDFATNLLTVIRRQNLQVLLYSIFAVVSFACTRVLVQQFSIAGAAFAYGLVMTTQASVMMLIVSALLRKGNADAAH